jgi:hypothetical protein
MTWTETFTCNVCGKRKGDVDHWWIAWVDEMRPSDAEDSLPRFQVLPWSELMARSPEAIHLCGAGCALKETERWMTSLSAHRRMAAAS